MAEAERATFVLLERRRVDAPLRGVGRGHRSEPAPGSGRWSGTAGGVPDVVGSPPRTHPGPQSPSWTPGDSHENPLHGGLWRFPLIEERKFRNTSGWGREFRADREIRAETRDLRKQKSGVTGGENGGRRGDWSPGSMKGRRSRRGVWGPPEAAPDLRRLVRVTRSQRHSRPLQAGGHTSSKCGLSVRDLATAL